MDLLLLTIHGHHIWLKLALDLNRFQTVLISQIMLQLLLDGVKEIMKKVKENIGLLEIQEEKHLELWDIINLQEEIMIMVSKQIFWLLILK